MSKALQLENKKFGFLIAKTLSEQCNLRKERIWECLCVCGNTKYLATGTLMSGNTQSCGCEGRGIKDMDGWTSSKNIIKKNFSAIWYAMKARCFNPLHKEYKNYGGRGITVCDRWLKFENFIEDMWQEYCSRKQNGERVSMDRIDVNGNYEPKNVRWATDSEQGKNKRNSIKSDNLEQYYYWENKLRHAFSRVLSGVVTNRSSIILKYSGLSLLEFKLYLESKFIPGMSWDNYGRGFGKWSLDHIIPCNKFDLALEGPRKECYNYTNLQPMWWIDNIKKGGC